jgi:hypothetical protein
MVEVADRIVALRALQIVEVPEEGLQPADNPITWDPTAAAQVAGAMVEEAGLTIRVRARRFTRPMMPA